MKKGAGCRVGAVAASRVLVVVTPMGPSVDATIQLVDPETGAVVGVTRKTRDWPEDVRTALASFLDAVEKAASERVFARPEDAHEKSIVEMLEGESEK